MADKNEDFFCGNDREEDLSDEYYNDFIVSIDDVDFDLEENEDDEED